MVTILLDRSAPPQGRPGSLGVSGAKGQASQAPGKRMGIPACGPKPLCSHSSPLSPATHSGSLSPAAHQVVLLPPPWHPQTPWAVSRLAPSEDLWAAEAVDCPCGSPQNSTAVLLPGWWTPSLGTCRCHRCGPLLLGSCSPPGPALTLWPCLCVARLLSWPASCKHTSRTPHPQHPSPHTPTHTHAPPHHL